MQWITVAKPPLRTLEQLDLVAAQIGPEPEGLIARYAGVGDDGFLRVVTVWESREHADRFLVASLGPALARVLGPEPAGAPELVGIEIARAYPVAVS